MSNNREPDAVAPIDYKKAKSEYATWIESLSDEEYEQFKAAGVHQFLDPDDESIGTFAADEDHEAISTDASPVQLADILMRVGITRDQADRAIDCLTDQHVLTQGNESQILRSILLWSIRGTSDAVRAMALAWTSQICLECSIYTIEEAAAFAHCSTDALLLEIADLQSEIGDLEQSLSIVLPHDEIASNLSKAVGLDLHTSKEIVDVLAAESLFATGNEIEGLRRYVAWVLRGMDIPLHTRCLAISHLLRYVTAKILVSITGDRPNNVSEAIALLVERGDVIDLGWGRAHPTSGFAGHWYMASRKRPDYGGFFYPQWHNQARPVLPPSFGIVSGALALSSGYMIRSRSLPRVRARSECLRWH